MDIDGAGVVFVWVALIGIFLISTLIKAIIVSGIFHLVSLVTKKRGLAFRKVLPYVFVVCLILNVFLFFG